MARKDIRMEELVEVLYQWHRWRNMSQIKRSTGLARKTIRKYIFLAEEHGFGREMPEQPYTYYLELAGKIQRGLKTPLEISPSYKKTSEYQNIIEKLRKRPYMKPKQIYRILKRDYEYSLSYSSYQRYMNIKYPKLPRNCLRIEVSAGEEGQVDFGSAGLMYDPEQKRMRRAHAFVMTLSYSRLPYVKFIFDQGQATWVKCHVNAFEFFGGVPQRIILDNLKSGILKPHTYDPVFNRAYAECAKHYGFIIDPAKIREPSHKGKVERKIPVVRQQFLSTYDCRDINDANEKVKEWALKEYGMEIHGTTKRKPSEVFISEEKEKLKALPLERFELPLWKEAKVHPDHHIVYEKSYYSLPTRYVGKKVWARGGFNTVQIFFEGELIKTHQRSYRPGTWRTDERDYPPEKSRYLMKSKSWYQTEALKHGSHVCRLVTAILTEHAYRNIRKIQSLLRLGEKHGSEALNLTSKRCLFYEDYRMSTIKRILDKKLYVLPLDDEEHAGQQPIHSQKKLTFLRPPDYFNHTKRKYHIKTEVKGQ
ncbi:MAG: IS21 family transposase [Nitrospirota bacterium]